MRGALSALLAACALGALAFGVQYVLELRAATAPPTPEAFVQTAWTLYRLAPGHRIHVGEQGIDCTKCHAPNTAQRFDEPGPGVCVSCHEEQTAIEHAKTALDAHGHRTDAGSARTMTDCLSCHGFGPDPEQKASDCLVCHAQAKGDRPAVVLHAKEECTTCHAVHDNRITPIACGECHDVGTSHGEHPAGSAAQCLDCHHVHAAANTAEQRCEICHQRPGEPGVPPTAASGGHTCTGCHAPHAFGKTEVNPCTSCHHAQPVLAGAGHQTCTGCHAPHDVHGSVERQNVCVGCHRDVALDHATPVNPSDACTSCHAPHPKPRAAEPAACTSCHQTIAATDLTAHADGMACVACHKPHDFERPLRDRAACGECHKARIAQLTHHPGHARCEHCHDAVPHGGMGPEEPCANCHEQGSSVHAGHEVCTGCHDAHTGARPPDVCGRCHRAEATLLSPKHGACQKCHDPHLATPAPEVAACSGCHKFDELPALHRVDEHHARCQTCHQAHAEQPPSQAETCRSCHREKADHQPQATQCSGCHPFEAPPKRRRG